MPWTNEISYSKPIAKQAAFFNELGLAVQERLGAAGYPPWSPPEIGEGVPVSSYLVSLRNYCRQYIEYVDEYFANPDTGDYWTLETLLDAAGYGPEWVTSTLKSDPSPWLQIRNAIDLLHTLREDKTLSEVADDGILASGIRYFQGSARLDPQLAWENALDSPRSSFNTATPSAPQLIWMRMTTRLVAINPYLYGYTADIRDEFETSIRPSPPENQYLSIRLNLSVSDNGYLVDSHNMLVGEKTIQVYPGMSETITVVATGEYDEDTGILAVPIKWDPLPEEYPFDVSDTIIGSRLTVVSLADPVSILWVPPLVYGNVPGEQ